MPDILTRCVAHEEKKGGEAAKQAWGSCIGRLGPKGLGYIKYDKKKKDWVLSAKGEEYEKHRKFKKEGVADTIEGLLFDNCPTPGLKIRSKGQGQGQGRAYGQGKGPKGVPIMRKKKFFDFELMARESFEEGNFTEVEVSDGVFIRLGKPKKADKAEVQSVRFDKKKHTLEKANGFMAAWFPKNRRAKRVKPTGAKQESTGIANAVLDEATAALISEKIVLATSYETVRADLERAIKDSNSYGKYPYVVATFPSQVVFVTDGESSQGTRYLMADWTKDKNGLVTISNVRDVKKQVSYFEV